MASRSRIVIFTTLFLLIINKAVSNEGIRGECWPPVTTDPGRLSREQVVPDDGQISLYYRTEVQDAVWITLMIKNRDTSKETTVNVTGKLTKSTERGRIDINTTNNNIYVTSQDLEHSSQPYHNSILTGITFRSSKRVEWTVCLLGGAPNDDTQNNRPHPTPTYKPQPHTNTPSIPTPTTHTTSTFTTSTTFNLRTTTPSITTTPNQPTITPNQPTKTSNQHTTPLSTDPTFDSTPNPKPQLGEDTTELIILSIVAVIIIPLIYFAYRGFCHYRRRYETAVKAKKELKANRANGNRVNGNRAIGNHKTGNSAIGSPEYDNPADHVYEEINLAGQENYSTGQYAQHSGLQRYNSDNSLYGAVLQPH